MAFFRFAERGQAPKTPNAVQPWAVCTVRLLRIRLNHAEHAARSQRILDHSEVAWLKDPQRQATPWQQQRPSKGEHGKLRREVLGLWMKRCHLTEQDR
jgi:hypothetical protein